MEALETPIGTLWLAANPHGLAAVAFAEAAGDEAAGAASANALLADAAAQLRAYFAGELRRFELPLAPQGTPFQRAVWEAVASIPYGRTATYAEIAAAIGRPRACRAVGAANGRNPLAVVVPCHRVVGSTGGLTGYGGGLDVKRRLLDFEARRG